MAVVVAVRIVEVALLVIVKFAAVYIKFDAFLSAKRRALCRERKKHGFFADAK